MHDDWLLYSVRQLTHLSPDADINLIRLIHNHFILHAVACPEA